VGPYPERGKWRIVLVENGKRKSVLLDTEAEALRAKAELERKAVQPASRRLGDVIDLWEQEQLRRGASKAESVREKVARVRGFMRPALDEDIAALTPRKAAALYERATIAPTAKTGQPLAVASHRFYLWGARSFFDWAIMFGCVGINPFHDVRPVGKLKAGKPQLRIDEARQFTTEALAYFERTGNPLAIGALVALMMGLRTSEVLLREVRDLDGEGQYLWVEQGKTANARRHLEVPVPLRPHLRRLAQGKRPTDLLFGAGLNGKPRIPQKLWEMVRRLCERAGVPVVCTHSLRGLHATLAVQSGAASHAVAASLGHGSFAVTQRHYAQASSVQNAATARVLSVLDAPLGQGEEAARALAERLRARLDGATRAHLARLLVEAEGVDPCPA
jgi:integrase